MNYFISDLHFGHENVLSFDNRPFLSVQDHDSVMIENWNNKVDIDDDVYVLGDISWYNVTKTIEILESLNGHKHLIVGNHDSHFLKNKFFRECFVEIAPYKELFLNEKESVVLSHYPIPCFKNHYYGWLHFYGHVHIGGEYNMMEHVKKEMEELYMKPCKMFNVGVMLPYMNYTPRSVYEIVGTTETE